MIKQLQQVEQKVKKMKKEDKTNKRQEMYITPEKRQQIIDDLRCYVKMKPKKL